MTLLRIGSLGVASWLLGCSRLVDPDVGDADDDVGDATDESSSDTVDDSTTIGGSTTEVETGDATDSSGSTDSTTTNSTTDSTDSTDSSETGDCAPELIECPDGACVPTFPDYGCCSHGGECWPGCEPQDADKGMGACPGDPEYAWNGEACKEVCPCQGSDCADVFTSPVACIEAHAIGCVGGMDFSQCPFDEPVMAISITGAVPGESVDLQAGAFGIAYGKGGGSDLMLRFAADELTLANHIAHLWSDPYLEGVLQVWAQPTLGVQQVSVFWGPAFNAETTGTLTILDLDIDIDSQNYFVTGTLEVTMGEWDLAGSFGIRHCYPLDTIAP
jgi:hypothetical protein